MEILSDTVFRGANVTLSGGKLSLTDGVSSTPGIELAGGPSGATFRCGLTVSNSSTLTSPTANINTVRSTNIDVTNLNTCNLVLNSDTISFENHQSIAFINGYGSSAHLNDASLGGSTVCGDADYAEILTTVNFDRMVGNKVSKLKYESIPINFNVPADCTKFTVDVTGNFTYAELLSARMMKLQDNVCFGVGQAQGYGASKFVDVDIWTPCTAIGKVLIEKSSSFAMCSVDSYQLKLIYY